MWTTAYLYTNNIETEKTQMTHFYTQRMPTKRVEQGFSIIGRYVYTVDITVNRGMVKEAESMPKSMLAIHSIYDMLRVFREEEVFRVLRDYLHLDEESMSILKHIGELEFVDLRKFASLLVWLVNVLGYKVTGASLVEDLETGELQFVSIHIDNCGWEEWRIISKLVKKRLVEEGFGDIAGRVALVCRKALQTLRS